MKSNRGRVIRDLGVLALSMGIILGLVLFERVNFPNGGDFRHPVLASLQGSARQIISREEIIYQRAKIAGHRGSAVKGQTMIDGELEDTKIGNTKQGIEKALVAGVEFIEIDLRTFAGDERDLVDTPPFSGGNLRARPGQRSFSTQSVVGLEQIPQVVSPFSLV